MIQQKMVSSMTSWNISIVIFRTAWLWHVFSVLLNAAGSVTFHSRAWSTMYCMYAQRTTPVFVRKFQDD